MSNIEDNQTPKVNTNEFNKDNVEMNVEPENTNEIENVIKNQELFEEELENNDDMYIISVNGVPYFYEKDLELARMQLQQIAKIYCEENSFHLQDQNEDSEYDCEDELNVGQKVNLFLFSVTYERYNIKIDKVQKFKIET